MLSWNWYRRAIEMRPGGRNIANKRVLDSGADATNISTPPLPVTQYRRNVSEAGEYYTGGVLLFNREYSSRLSHANAAP
jgi:hypothetical protein